MVDIPHITVEPGTVIFAHAADLSHCLMDGFSAIEGINHPVRVIYGDYASLSLLRDHEQSHIEDNALWGAKLIEDTQAPDHTFVLVGEIFAMKKEINLSALVVHVTIIFQ